MQHEYLLHNNVMSTNPWGNISISNIPLQKTKSIETIWFQHSSWVGLLNFHLSVSSAYGNRTRDSAVRGRRLDLLTNAPFFHACLSYHKCRKKQEFFVKKENLQIIIFHVRICFAGSEGRAFVRNVMLDKATDWNVCLLIQLFLF